LIPFSCSKEMNSSMLRVECPIVQIRITHDNHYSNACRFLGSARLWRAGEGLRRSRTFLLSSRLSQRVQGPNKVRFGVTPKPSRQRRALPRTCMRVLGSFLRNYAGRREGDARTHRTPKGLCPKCLTCRLWRRHSLSHGLQHPAQIAVGRDDRGCVFFKRDTHDAEAPQERVKFLAIG